MSIIRALSRVFLLGSPPVSLWQGGLPLPRGAEFLPRLCSVQIAQRHLLPGPSVPRGWVGATGGREGWQALSVLTTLQTSLLCFLRSPAQTRGPSSCSSQL